MNLTTAPLPQTMMGIVARLEGTRVALPLKAIEIEAEVTGDLVSVELDQVFLQDHDSPLNCTYTFPLPADAAVYRCEMHVGGRVIEAKVKSKEEARRIYERQVADGHRAALAQMDRQNLFNLDLGNLQPRDLVRIRFAYVQELERLDDLRSLRVPLTPSVRYIPGQTLPRANQGTGTVDDTDQVPDASRVSPPRIDSLHPDAATFHARVKMDSPLDALGDLQSPSHAIEIQNGEARTVIELQSDEEAPSQDFVVNWATKPSLKLAARGWVTEHRGRPYACLRLDGGPLPEEETVEERDVYILLDRSGSMNGHPWKAACQAVESFVRKLPSSTRISLTLFETKHTNYTERPVPASEFLSLIGRNASSLIALGPTGGTNLAPALDEVFSLRNQHSAGQSAVILLITDGMVGNERAIVNRACRSSTTMHFVGIGLAPNDALKSAAETTGGQAVFCHPTDNLEPKFARFASRLGKPLFDRAFLPPGWEHDDDSQIYSLYPGEQRLFMMRGEQGARLDSIKILRGAADAVIETSVTEVENEALPLLWARQRIRTLESRGQTEEAERLSLEFNLPSSRTSFVAWDRQDQVLVATRHLHQPSSHIEDRMESIAPMARFSRGPSSGAMGSVAPPAFDGIARQYSSNPFEDSELDGMMVQSPKERSVEKRSLERQVFGGSQRSIPSLSGPDSRRVPLASKPKSPHFNKKKVSTTDSPKVGPALQAKKESEKKRGLISRLLRKFLSVILKIFGLSRAKK